MAYKFQYGDAVYSGSLNIETNLTGSKVSLGTANSAASVARGTLDLSDADGASYGLKLGSTLVTADASELNKLDGVTATTAELNYVDTTAGTAAASKAVVLDGSKNIATLGTVGCGAITSTGASSFGSISSVAAITATGVLSSSAQISGSSFWGDGSGLSNITATASPAGSDTQVQFNQNGSTAANACLTYDGSGSLDLSCADPDSSIGLKLAGALVTATAAELNLLDTATAGSVVNSKAVIYSGAGKVQGTTFLGPDDVTFGGASVTDMITIGSDEVVFKDGSININIASHDGSNGLELGGTLVTSTAAELNLIDGSGAGSVVNSKAVIYDGGGYVNATQLSSSFGITGSALTLAGTAVTSTAAELNLVDGSSAGTVVNSKGVIYSGGGHVNATQLSSSFGLSGSALTLLGVAVTATGTELNYLDITTLGTAAASKALVADGSANLDASAITFTDLGTVTTVDINGGTIDGTTIGVSSAAVVTASYLAVNGNVDLGNGSDVINIGSGGSDSLYLNAMANFEAGAAYNMQSITSNDTLSAGDFYNIVSGSGAITVTLPNVNNIDDGTMFHVKRAYGMENDVTVASGSGQNSIDGEALVVLESELAAISLLWDSNAGVWHIF